MVELMQNQKTILTTEAVGPQIYKQLRDRIIIGDLLPGVRLSETEIASVYSISRQPVREAFIKLAEEELVSVRPQRGTYITRISVSAVLAARFIREAVEADIVRKVAETVSAAGLNQLLCNLGQQEAAKDRGDARAFMDLDDAFHRLLAQLADEQNAWDFLEALKSQMNRVRHIAVQQYVPEKLVVQHTDILAAIQRRDPDAAEAAMRKHLRQVLMDLPDIAQAQPGFFDTEEIDT